MSTIIYPTDALIIEGLTKAIAHCQRGGAAPAPPTAAQLVELLSSAFAASFETEEGRGAAFTVAFFADPQSHFAYSMKTPIPLSPRDLVRLAVALDPSRARICIVPGESSLQIAGVIHLGAQDAGHGTRLTLFELCIRVLGPSILLVRYNNNLLLTYRRGKFALHAEESTLFKEYNVKHALSHRSGLPANRTPEELQADGRFRNALVRIARTMLRLGHGGTLLIVPDGAEWESRIQSSQYAPSVPVMSVKAAHDQQMLHEATRNEAMQLMKGQGGLGAAMVLSDEAIRSGFHSALEWLARLTGTDGMTVIQRDFTLLGFGVFFNTQEEEGDTTQVQIIDPYTSHKSRDLAAIGGARHQSAAVTCRRIPGATAVVVSQDGGLSSMKWEPDEKVVIVFRHLELLLDV